MKNSKFFFTLMSFTGIINIDTGWAMLPSIEGISRIAVKKTPQALRVRDMHTKGYKPTEPIQMELQVDYLPREKIRFIDKNHERYIHLNHQSVKASTEKSNIIKKDDHTIVVDLKKKTTQ